MEESFVTPKIKVFIDSPWRLESIVNDWLEENNEHIMIHEIQYQYPDAKCDRASVMIFYVEVKEVG